jgi:D-amino-acid dehydrogenase
MQLAEKEMMALVDRAGMAKDPPRRLAGTLRIRSAASGERGRMATARRRRHRLRACARATARGIAAGPVTTFVAGTFVPGWKTVSEPQAFAGALWAHAERHGAIFEKAEVRGIEQSGAKPSLRLADGSIREADRIVICAGAWSARLLKTITSLRIPLETERGYNTTLPNGAFDVKRQLILAIMDSLSRRSKPGSGSAARWSLPGLICRRTTPGQKPCWTRRRISFPA